MYFKGQKADLEFDSATPWLHDCCGIDLCGHKQTNLQFTELHWDYGICLKFLWVLYRLFQY